MTIVADHEASPKSASAASFASSRRAMIDSQLRPSGVTSPRVVAALEMVAREDFVPDDKRGHAYFDRGMTLPDGGALAAPLVQGKMLEEAMAYPGEKALVIENGSGYLAALLTAMGAQVTVEPARKAVTSRKKGEYDIIVIDGAVDDVPSSLAKRLAPEGRLITGVVDNGVTRLARGRLAGKSIALLQVADLSMPILSAFAAEKGWSF